MSGLLPLPAEFTDPPRRLLLACGHVWTEGDPEPVGPVFRVVRFRDAWAVEDVAGAQCARCAAWSKPTGLTWGAAWAEVERRQAAEGRPWA